ncbi:MAG: hypothetical protein GC136_10045 [Alphaproteobacteria bacterium]|nr:hypothetical protein [Alphaproteobacteria bacterium]
MAGPFAMSVGMLDKRTLKRVFTAVVVAAGAFAPVTPPYREPASITTPALPQVPTIDPNILPDDPCQYTPDQTRIALLERPLPEGQAQRFVLMNCVRDVLEQIPNADQLVTTTENYLRQYDLTDAQINLVRPYIPENYIFIREDHPYALTLMLAESYLNAESAGIEPDQNFFDGKREVFEEIVSSNYALFPFRSICDSCDGGIILAPVPSIVNETSLATPLTLPHMQTPQWQRDFNLLITFHELGHVPCFSLVSPAIGDTDLHFEACGDVVGISLLSAVRGYTPRAAHDFLQYRRIQDINKPLRLERSVDAAHSTYLILNEYFYDDAGVILTPQTMLQNLDDINGLGRTPAFTNYSAYEITGATREAFRLMSAQGLNSPDMQVRAQAARNALAAIDSDRTHAYYPITRDIVEDYMEATNYWYGPSLAHPVAPSPITLQGP